MNKWYNLLIEGSEDQISIVHFGIWHELKIPHHVPELDYSGTMILNPHNSGLEFQVKCDLGQMVEIIKARVPNIGIKVKENGRWRKI